MCAINGFTFADRQKIEEMNRRTRHRGPDQTNCWVGEGISLGHNRLAIIDLSERGAQPMWDAAGEICIVYNGELYNFQELRRALEPKYQFRSASDTEVALYAYREYGRDCLAKFNGIFAFAIWDARSRELWLARDPGGVNPLYYFWDGQRLIFSSEIKAILAHDIPRAVDREAFSLFFELLYVPAPHTMFLGIKKLPPAHYLRWQEGEGIKVERYWQITDWSTLTDPAETVGRLRDLFRNAVRDQLVSDRPVGIFLSGGLDSTAVLGAVAERGGGKIKTYSVGFRASRDEEKFNTDFRLARQTARWYGADHHELLVGPDDLARELPAIVWHLDEPNANATAAAIFLLARLAKQSVAVVLGGDGGDELFGGYPRYYYSALIERFQKLPGGAQTIVRRLFSACGYQKTADKLGLPPTMARAVAFLCQKEQALAPLLNREQYHSGAASSLLAAQFPLPPYIKQDFVRWFQQLDRGSWLPDESLLRSNKLTMSSGLEPRVPILDIRLVELAAKIPSRWQIKVGRTIPGSFVGKHLWRQAIDSYLPPAVKRQPKRGWFTPTAKWLRQESLRSTVNSILSPDRLAAEWFNGDAVRQIWREHLAGGYHLNTIWSVVMWQLWYEKFIKKL
ncbi:MAG: asparagine synthase (glutamine-hydrolyzing) [Candidatus Magasanikbacteria bacterium]|nr:asparagine synthase (glutamine-hydrolyzing) [Candidatus Magasanikbacteria bacterium]